jgi:hypothetical protein
MAQPEEWLTYHNEKFGYELEYPAGWNVIEAQPRTDDMPRWDGDVLSPGVLQKVTFQEPEGKFWPGEFLVLVREQAKDRTLDEWADENFTDVHDESLVSGVEHTTLADRTARQFSIFGFDHTGTTVAFVHNCKIYEIRYIGSTPNDPDIAEHRSIYEHMKRSFRLVPSIETADS